jgi:transcriptional regulator with XRE-family HTH domain
MEDIKNKPKSLQGLRLIRDTLGVVYAKLSSDSSVSLSHLMKIENGQCGCSVDILTKVANALSCSPNDLLGEPSTVRLAEIKVAYQRRELERAEEALAKLSGVDDPIELCKARLAMLRDQAKQEQDRLEHLQFLEVCGETEEAA